MVKFLLKVFKWIGIYVLIWWLLHQLWPRPEEHPWGIVVFMLWSVSIGVGSSIFTWQRATTAYSNLIADMIAQGIKPVAAESKPSTPTGHVDATQLPDLKKD